MGQIQDFTRPVELSKTGTRNTVEAVTEVKMYAAKFSGDDGVVTTALLLHYGTDNGKPNIMVFADEASMMQTLKIPNRTLLDGVRAWLSAQTPVEATDIPTGVL